MQGGQDLIVVSYKVQNHTLDAAFSLNGKLLATATGDPKSPVIRGEGGRELTQEEMAALGAIAGLAEGVFKLFYELLEPAGALLGMGLGL